MTFDCNNFNIDKHLIYLLCSIKFSMRPQLASKIHIMQDSLPSTVVVEYVAAGELIQFRTIC